MFSGQKLKELRIAAGRSRNDVVDALSRSGLAIGYKAYSNWEVDRAKPSVDQFLCVCEYLGIEDAVSEFQQRIDADALNSDGLRKVREYRRDLIASGNYIPEHPKAMKLIRLYDVPVSAGLGEFLDSDHYENLEVDELPRGADFALRISGDSMSPRYVDKQIIFCHQQPLVEDGEIGIFDLNGKSYCKQLRKDGGKVYLVSLNRAYEPIEIKDGDDLRIFARVLS